MALTLTIENETSLPDGGPLSVTIQGTRGLDIGRDQYLDWTLPDPSRFISGRHCEIRWHEGAYWLHDISTNGTFLDGDSGRLKAPHRLRNGDRFLIGHYVILATIDGNAGVEPHQAGAAHTPQAVQPDYERLWDADGEAAPPIDPKQLKAPRDLQPVKPDFLEWAIHVDPGQRPIANTAAPVAPSRHEDMSWAQASPKPAPQPPAEPNPVPSPRRPVWVTGEPDGPWASRTQESGPSDAAPVQMPAGAGGAAQFLQIVARDAGLPEQIFAQRNPDEVAREIGQLMRLMAENMRQLLEARQQAKRMVRSSSHTTVQALDNNPLKFSPSAEDALRIMFGPKTSSYLDANKAFAQAFGDLKVHQVKTFSAMQQALTRLMQEFDPAAIEQSASADRGLLAAIGSHKARLWDVFAARWQARGLGEKEAMLNAFMAYFAECYDRNGNGV